MKRIRLMIAGIALLSLLPFSAAVHGAAPVTPPPGLFTSGTLTFGTNFGYPPMEELIGKSGTIQSGADIEIGRAIAAKMGLKAAFINITDFGVIIVGLQSHHFDAIISSMNITPDREKTLDFVPYFNAGQSIVVKKGNPLHITSLADLSGKSISVQSGTVELASADAENAVFKKQGKPQMTIKNYGEDAVALQQLALGRTVAELTDYPVAVYDSTQFPNQFQIAGQQWGATPYGIAVNKSDNALYKAIGAAFNLVKSDGEYSKILAKYHLGQGALS
jgi:polar amino acid transport system substrate-binding protein